MSGSGDNNPDPQSAQRPQASLQRQNERLQLLLNLTSRITSNLDLREVLRAISANFREVMRCDGAGIWLPGEGAGTFKLYAFDAPVSKGFGEEFAWQYAAQGRSLVLVARRFERVSLDDISRQAQPNPLHPQHGAYHHG